MKLLDNCHSLMTYTELELWCSLIIMNIRL